MKCIYYGAGLYAQANFDRLSKKYEPVYFCDAHAIEGQTFLGLTVLPPSALIESELPILITRFPFNIIETQAYLIEILNIPQSRIVNYEPYETKLTCHHLEDEIYFGLDHAYLCCAIFGHNKTPKVDFSESATPKEKVREMIALKDRISKALSNGEECECSGCPALSSRLVSTKKSALSYISFIFSNLCNLSCIYCNANLGRATEIDIESYSSLISEMHCEGLIDESTSVGLWQGELALHPQKKDILSVLTPYYSYIISNCTVYDECIAEHLALGRSVINTSLDCGTAETYAKIKGADLFNEVIMNIKKYSELTKFDMKYIFLPGINDNINDIDGFIKLIDDISTRCYRIILSRDGENITELSDHTIYAMAYLTNAAKLRKIPLVFHDVRTTFSVEELARYEKLLSEIN